jgi:signal transduction histidine kinase
MTDKITIEGTATPQPSITFSDNSFKPVMIIRPDGKIELDEGADPTEAAARCVEAMGQMITNMIDNAVKAEREAIVAWLRAQWEPGCWVDFDLLADCIEGGPHLK